MAVKKFNDPRGAHIRIYWALLDSPAWFALSFSQRALYVACRRKLTSNSNGNLAFTLAGLAAQGFTASSSTLASGLRALQAVGFIAVTREGGKVNRGQAIPTLYRFTDEPCHQWVKLDIPSMKPSNEWQQFANVQTATDAINAAESKARADHALTLAQREQRATEKNPPIRNSKRDSSKFKAGTVFRLRKSNRERCNANRCNARSIRRCAELCRPAQKLSTGFEIRTPMQIAIDRLPLWLDCGRHATIGSDNTNLRKPYSAGALETKQSRRFRVRPERVWVSSVWAATAQARW